VFDCFTDPARLARWWGPLGCENSDLRVEPRPGGPFALHMQGPGYSHDMGGEFVEIDRPRRLVFRTKAFEAPDGGWGVVNYNTLIFEDAPGGATRLTLHTRVEKADGALVLGALAGMRAGWGQSLERLGDLVGGGGKMDIEVSPRRIVLARAFDAPRERVWAALTDPALFARWWIEGSVVETMDVRVGGEWRVRAPGADGAEHRFWGEYRAVEPPARLALTQGFDAHAPIEVEVVLDEEWGRTLMTRTMDFPDDGYRDAVLGSGLIKGATMTYDALARLLKAA
jgi:uncharacterized protein YndB with AHSA1/START domain